MHSSLQPGSGTIASISLTVADAILGQMIGNGLCSGCSISEEVIAYLGWTCFFETIGVVDGAHDQDQLRHGKHPTINPSQCRLRTERSRHLVLDLRDDRYGLRG